MAEVGRRMTYIYPPTHFDLAGIDLRAEEQKQLLLEFLPYYASPLIERHHNPSSRYFRPNISFHFQDAFTLYAMLRRFKPKRLVEVGCGMSSCVILDSCEKLQLGTTLALIDPHPNFLLGLIRPTDQARFNLRKECVQDVPFKVFSELEAGDILFIDTSHSSKIGSDVNHIFFVFFRSLKKASLFIFTTFGILLSIQLTGCIEECFGTRPTFFVHSLCITKVFKLFSSITFCSDS